MQDKINKKTKVSVNDTEVKTENVVDKKTEVAPLNTVDDIITITAVDAWRMLSDFAESKGVQLIDEDVAPRNAFGRIRFVDKRREDFIYFETRSCGKAYRRMRGRNKDPKTNEEAEKLRKITYQLPPGSCPWWEEYLDDILFYILYYGENAVSELPYALSIYEEPTFNNLDNDSESDVYTTSMIFTTNSTSTF